MENKINKQLNKIKSENRLGIMTHIVVGNPSLEESKELVRVMARSGVDFIEMQIPFSDPMADGPTIMKANKTSLDNQTKVKDCFDLMRELSGIVDVPLLFMGYYNTVFNYGVARFCQEAKEAGASGLIFPDIPIEEEENEKYIENCEKNNLIHVRLLSPASTKDRIVKNAEVAKGFVYFVGRKGTTGVKSELDRDLGDNLNKVKEHINLPIAVGFGISEAGHINALKNKADIAVIGSAVLDIYSKAVKGGGLEAVKKFLQPLIKEAKL